MKGKEIIDKYTNLTVDILMYEIHARALACHCECLGMNAENSLAVCNNIAPPYSDKHYFDIMKKWNLINEKGEPTI